MAHRTTLTERQVEILRWVADGCPAGVMDGVSHRVSAAALRRRDLVRISGRGASWQASITPAGRAYLKEADGPTPPAPRQGNRAVTLQLIDEIVAAGGVLRVPSWPQPGEVDYGRRARLAIQHRKVPPGQRLLITRLGQEIELRLQEAPGEVHERAPLLPVPVPQRVRRLHAAARGLRDRRERHEVSTAQLSRAVRVVHAVAVEAERRGWEAKEPQRTRNGNGQLTWTGTKDGHLRLGVGDAWYWVRVQESGVRTRGPWEEEVKRNRSLSQTSIFWRERELASGPFDAGAKGSLVLQLHDAAWWRHRGRRARFADGASATVEDTLPRLFAEIEERVDETRRQVQEETERRELQAREEAERAAAHRARWEIEMASAHERHAHDHRASALIRQAEDWQRAQLINSYCEAWEAAHGEDERTAEWLAWARAYAQELDPLSTVPEMPVVPPATLATLQAFLPDGFSAAGPEERPVLRQALLR